MKILIVSAVFPPEPVVSSHLSFDVAEMLQRNNNNVTVLCPKPSRPYGFNLKDQKSAPLTFNKITVDSFTCPKSSVIGRIREGISFGIQCYKFIKKNHKDIDLVYANTWPLFAQYCLIMAKRKYGIPLILHIQDIYPEAFAEKHFFLKKLLNFFFVPFDRFILLNSNSIITISDSMKEYLVRTRDLNERKVTTIRNWQNDKAFSHQHHNTNNRAFTFMFLGTINPTANVETLIHAFGRSHLKASKLIIAGEGPSKANCQKLANIYPETNIEFIQAPLEQVNTIQQQSDILLLSLQKGIAKTATPSKLIAYMFSGKPIIACVEEETDTGQIILSSGSGFVVPPEDINALSNCMRYISTLEKDKLNSYGQNSVSFAKQYLSQESGLLRIMSLVNSTMNQSI